MEKEKRQKGIDTKILDLLNSEPRPISTRELAIKAKLSWHTVINHCLRLQIKGRLDGYKIGNINVWIIKKEEK
jgi:DNA-binding Lrp family transcriptional regulator